MSDLDQELDAILAGTEPKGFTVTIEDAPPPAAPDAPVPVPDAAARVQTDEPPAPAPAAAAPAAPAAPTAPVAKRQRRAAEPVMTEIPEKVDELADIRTEFPDLPDYVLAELAAGRDRLRTHAARSRDEALEEV